MSTDNSTHLSKTPSMATAESTKTYSTQLQSPLYRLPRELRDEIYKHYADGRRSYEYNKDTQKLRYRDAAARAENLGLIVTCKIAAEEMKQVAFQKAEFSTRCSAYDGQEFMSVRSRAVRLHCCKSSTMLLARSLTNHFSPVTNIIQTQRQRMLICVAGLLQSSDFDDIESRYPNMGLYIGGQLPQAVARRHDYLIHRMASIRNDDVVFQACIDALLFALNCANTRNPEQFKQLTSGVFGHGTCPVGFSRDDNNLFKKGSLDELLLWRPDPWWIPEDEDLSRIETFLCKQTNPGPVRGSDGEMNHFSLNKFRCYFSATAVAIDYCK